MSTAPRPELRVSVAMASHNGARWIGEQLASILAELSAYDEVVVVDDASLDDTPDLVEAVGDPRLRVIRLETNRGYVRAFERALLECTGDVVLLADQDDVWVPGRRELMLGALVEHQVVASNLVLLGSGEPLRGPFGQETWTLHERDQGRHVANMAALVAGNRPYYGCAMGVRREVLAVALPFPDFLTESHDLWLAAYGNLARSIAHLETPTLRRRVHDDNATPDRPRGVGPALRSRLMLLRGIVELRRRLR